MTPAAGVRLGDLELSNPVMTASGCGGTGPELARFVDLPSLGAFVTRTVTLEPREVAVGRRVVETPSGLLAADPTAGPGLQGFLATELPELARSRVRTVVSVAGASLGEYAELAQRVGDAPGVSALEVNAAELDPGMVGRVTSTVRGEAPRGVAVLVKLASGPELPATARSAVRGGADAVVVGHGPAGLRLDPVTLRPLVAGRLSGPAVHPLALQAVHMVHAALPDVPVVGVGGVGDGAAALAMLAAGASAVQVGTATLHDPDAPARVLRELTDELAARRLDVADVVGVAHRGGLL